MNGSAAAAEDGPAGRPNARRMGARGHTRVLKAHAKLNLRLDIFGAQENGLHALRSLLGELALCDEVSFQPAQDGFSVSCIGAQIEQRENLAWRAAQALGVPLPKLHVRISKSIPLQAGLGGGSADAAAVLGGLVCELRDRGMAVDDGMLLRAAAAAGSDVPACLYPGLKLVQGTGERVQRLGLRTPEWGVLLLQPESRVATAAAYALLDAQRKALPDAQERRHASDRLCQALAAADLAAASAWMHNDFEALIEQAFPDIAAARRRLRQAGAQAAILCGSGSCVAGLFQSEEDARRALSRVPLQGAEWIAATRLIDER